MISAPTQRIECDKNEDNPSGHKPGVRMLWNSAMPGTNAQLTEPWVRFSTAPLTSTIWSGKPSTDLPCEAGAPPQKAHDANRHMAHHRRPGRRLEAGTPRLA